MLSVEAARQFYADEIRTVANLQSAALVDALASIPREAFLGPGPWDLATPDPRRPGAVVYRKTPDANPRHIYHNVLVAIDASRELNNGHPGTLAACLDALNLAPGETFLHVGCGVGATFEPGPCDAILVNAGFTHPLPIWLDSLKDGGRLLLPITVTSPGNPIGAGGMLLVTREADHLRAQPVMPIAIFASPTGREDSLNAVIRQAFATGNWFRMKSVRRGHHVKTDACCIHTEGVCLSQEETRAG